MMTKTCSRCRQARPHADFGRNRSNKDGLSFYCKPCRREIDRARYDAVLRTPTARQRGQELADRREALGDDMSQEAVTLFRRYGITRAQRDEIMRRQNHCCAMCGKQTDRLVVDHDHGTGRVRGLLCLTCNFELGTIEDSVFMEAAHHYLSRHEEEAAAVAAAS